MKALLLLLLIGACQALQPGLEYQYQYSARVATGIPDLNRQFAAAGIQADVTVQVLEDSTVVQFSHVEVGELNKVLDCDLRAPVPIEYHPMQDQAALLEKPFRVTHKESGVPDFLESPDEPIWITNIRKSIVNIFRIPMLWQPEAYSTKLNFGEREDILAGYCQNWYTSLKFPIHEAEEINYFREQIMEEDVQRETYAESYTTKGKGKTSKTSKTSSKTTSKTASKTGTKTSGGSGEINVNIPQIEDTLWQVTRTTDFDMCDGLVAVEIHGSKYADDVIQRSSLGSYIIRGDTHKRIEEVVVEGTISILTNKENNEHLDTFSNQTLELKAVRELKNPISIDYDVHPHFSWHYEIERPQADGQFIPLEQAITGRPVTEQMANNIVEYIKTSIDELAVRMGKHPAKADNLAYVIGRLVEAVANLDYAHIETLFQHYVGQLDLVKKYIFHQLVINAGTEPAVTIVVDKLKNPALQDIYNVREDFYNLLPIGIRTPAVIPKIMELVMHEDESMTHFIGLMNFATLANEACLNPKKKHFYYDFSCSPHSVCQPETIVDQFIPYLVEGLGNQESDVWKRIMYVQTLSNLGTPQTVDVLKPIILGITETNVFVRTNAIWSLSAFNQHKATLAQVYEILMPIIDNHGEQFEIRNIAFLTLVTWGPGNAWWQQLALNTWHDPSPQFANFVSTTISSVAHSHSSLAEVAKRVERLAKPASISVLHSTNVFLHEYLFSEEHGIKLNFAWFASIHGAIPEELFIRIQEEFFYGYVALAKLDLQQRGLDETWFLLKEQLYTRKKQQSSTTREIVIGMWEELKEKLGIPTVDYEPELKMWVKMDRVIQQIIHLVNGQDQHPIITKDVNVYDWIQLPMFNRMLNTFIALPTDVGIPFSVTYVSEMANWFKITDNIEYSFSKTKVKGNVRFVFDGAVQSFVEARTYLPWSEKPGISSGLYHAYAAVLPLNVHASADLQTQEIQFSAEPTTTSKFDVFHIEFTPFTVLENNYPSEVIIKENEYKPIFVGEVPVYSDKHQVFPTDVGLWVEISTDGDMKFPPSLHELLTSCFGGYLKYNTWESTISFDPSVSNTKTVSFIFNYVSSGTTAPISQGDYDGQFTQETGGSDYEFGQFHQSSDFQDISEVDSFDVQSETRDRIVRLQQQLISSGGHVRTVSVFIELQGTPTRSYEASLTWAVSSSPSARSFKIQVTLLKHPAVGQLEDAHTICLNAQIVKPQFSPFFTTEELLQVNYHSTLRADLFDGITCEEAPVFTLEGTFDVSETMKNKIKENIEHHCEYSTYAPSIDVITSPVYDNIHITSAWKPNFPDNLKNLTYYAYDTLKGVLSQHTQTDYTTAHFDSKIDVDATKCLDTGLWTVRLDKPSSVSIVNDLKVPELVGVFFTPAPLTTTLMYNTIVGRDPIACTIETTQVRTFDAKVFSYEPEQCWNTMTFDMSNNQIGAMLVRYTGQFEVRIIWHAEGLVFDLTPTDFLLNGEPAKGTDDRYTVLQHDNTHTIVFNSGTRVKISDKVELLMSLNHRGHTAGLCGNFDGEPSNDMVGPLGCSYTDPSLFALSWASPGEGCAAFLFRSKKSKVDDYQESCNHLTYEPTGVTHDQSVFDCTEWVYHERKEGVYHCKALTPMPVCKPHCTDSYPTTTQVEYECSYSGHKQQAEGQQQQTQGTQFKECFTQSYSLSYPASCVPQ